MAAEDDGLPTIERCDLTDPEESALWALIGLPDVNGAPVMVGFPHLRTISARIEACGFRYHPELATIKYRAPAVAPSTPFGDQGQWVPIDDPDPEPDPLGAQLDQIRPEVQREVARRMQEQHPEWFQEDS